MATSVDAILTKVKANLVIQHDSDNDLIKDEIRSAISYAEGYQHLEAGYYQTHDMSYSTLQAIVMLSSHFYESRDGSTGGFFADNTNASKEVWDAVKTLLVIDKEWKV